MAITKRYEEGKIEVVGKFRNVQIRTTVIIEEDGKEISRSYERKVLQSRQDITNESSEVKAICNAVWTPAVKKKLADYLAASET